jgi:HlyD family secretion protein
MAALWKKIARYKFWLVGLVVILVAAKIAAGSISAGKTQQKVSTIGVERGNIVSVVSATGTVSPVNMVDVSSKISGLVKEVKVSENQQVKAGQVLLTLDDTHLQAQVAQAQAHLSDASGTLERTQRLHDMGAVADQQLDSAVTNYNVAKAAYDDAVSQLADTVIKSPIDGTVIGKPIPAGQAVAPGISSPMVLLTVADMNEMQIETQVDESDIGKVKVGQNVSFTVDAYPGKTFTGTVSNVSQKATVQQNVVYYNVLIDVANNDNMLKPTMTARVSINVGESKNTLVVPLAVVKTINGHQTVAVMKNGKVENVPVTTGLANDDQIEILSGLSEGDQIAAPQAKTQEAKSGNGQAGGPGAGMFRGLGR